MIRLTAQAALAMLVAALCGSAADLYRVAGVMVNAETGEPLPRAFVALQKVGSTAVVASGVTGDDGRFAFALPQGKYDLQGGTRAAIEMYGNRAPEFLAGTSVITGPDQDTSALLFRWYPMGGISGRIVDESGEPVENALVELVRSNVSGGRRWTAAYGWVRTDDRGEFRFGRLRASTYFLAVTGRPWYSTVSAAGPEAGEPSMAYAPVYYPNSLDKGGAEPIVLKSGQEFRADFALHTVLGSTLKITYDKPDGLKGSVSLVMEGIGTSDGYERRETLQPRGQTMSGVAPGRYLLRVRAARGDASVGADQEIEVAGSTLEARVILLPAPTVSGTLQLESLEMKPKGTILVALVEPVAGIAVPASLQPNGSLSVRAAPPGKYRPQIRGVDGYFVSDVHVEGAPFQDGMVELTWGALAVMRIVASDRTGRVEGFAMRGEQAVAGAWVLLAPVSESASAPAAHAFQTDSDGSFDYQDVPAGDYFLFALESGGVEYSRRDVIRPYLANATRIHVDAHQSYSERIGVMAIDPR